MYKKAMSTEETTSARIAVDFHPQTNSPNPLVPAAHATAPRAEPELLTIWSAVNMFFPSF
jgi:hypothetical protein